jgi:hypothetical protein
MSVRKTRCLQQARSKVPPPSFPPSLHPSLPSSLPPSRLHGLGQWEEEGAADSRPKTFRLQAVPGAPRQCWSTLARTGNPVWLRWSSSACSSKGSLRSRLSYARNPCSHATRIPPPYPSGMSTGSSRDRDETEKRIPPDQRGIYVLGARHRNAGKGMSYKEEDTCMSHELLLKKTL